MLNIFLNYHLLSFLIRSSNDSMLFFIISKFDAKLSCTPFKRDLLLSKSDVICDCNSSKRVRDLLNVAAKTHKKVYLLKGKCPKFYEYTIYS